MQDLIHIYTGDGKGKTSAAVGLACRARGAGLGVTFASFTKGRHSSEYSAFEKLGINHIIDKTDVKFSNELSPQEFDAYAQRQRALFAAAQAQAKLCDVLVLDEVFALIALNIISEQALIDFMRQKPPALELVLTGRGASAAAIELAHYVSDIAAIKHPYTEGTDARKGIEF